MAPKLHQFSLLKKIFQRLKPTYRGHYEESGRGSYVKSTEHYQAVEKLDLYTNAVGIFPYDADVNTGSGCSKGPQFSPAQPRRAKTRRSASKAAATNDSASELTR